MSVDKQKFKQALEFLKYLDWDLFVTIQSHSINRGISPNANERNILNNVLNFSKSQRGHHTLSMIKYIQKLKRNIISNIRQKMVHIESKCKSESDVNQCRIDQKNTLNQLRTYMNEIHQHMNDVTLDDYLSQDPSVQKKIDNYLKSITEKLEKDNLDFSVTKARQTQDFLMYSFEKSNDSDVNITPFLRSVIDAAKSGDIKSKQYLYKFAISSGISIRDFVNLFETSVEPIRLEPIRLSFTWDPQIDSTSIVHKIVNSIFVEDKLGINAKLIGVFEHHNNSSEQRFELETLVPVGLSDLIVATILFKLDQLGYMSEKIYDLNKQQLFVRDHRNNNMYHIKIK